MYHILVYYAIMSYITYHVIVEHFTINHIVFDDGDDDDSLMKPNESLFVFIIYSPNEYFTYLA